MAGYKYFNDNIQTDVTQHIPILITKKDSSNACDKIEIVYGDINYDRSTTPPTPISGRSGYSLEFIRKSPITNFTDCIIVNKYA